MSQDPVQVSVNGERHCLPQDTSLTSLLTRLNLMSQRIAIERNAQIVPKSQYEQTVLESGDQIEVITAIGGG